LHEEREKEAGHVLAGLIVVGTVSTKTKSFITSFTATAGRGLVGLDSWTWT
jgi:hypothetical protein